MINKFYIDESGNTGDLVMTEENLNFSSQEYFTLSCVSLKDEKLNELESFIKELKKKYKIQNKELKFGKIKHIFDKKIGFILELLKYIEEDSCILIEIVNKKYIIATNIVNCLVNPPYFQEKKDIEDEKKLHLILSQWIYDYIPNEFFIKFSNIARSPSEKGLSELFHDLLDAIEKVNNEMSNAVRKNVKESIDDYEIMKQKLEYNKDKRAAYTYFLPLPDKNKRGELIGMLPHISSFTNLHARLNHIYGDDLSSITIIHDNHAHFDEIIKQYHHDAIDNKEIENNKFEMANFNFKSISKLEFHDDKNKIGLQIADIFAGLINTAIPYFIKNKKTLTINQEAILLQILTNLYFQKAIDFVLPMNHNNEKIFPILEIHLRFIMKVVSIGIHKETLDIQLLEPNKSLERNI